MTSFWVPGEPLSKGSVVAWKHPKTGAVIKRDQKAKELAAWGGRVAAIALANGISLEPARPLRVSLQFHLSRPKGHWNKKGLTAGAPLWHTKRPDADKLSRAALDALTGIAYADDSQVVELEAKKVYANPAVGPGVRFDVEPLASVVF